MILIKVWKPDGTLVGMCDGECHDAFGPEKSCVCGGHFRGASHRGSFDQMRRTTHAVVRGHLARTYPGYVVHIRPPQLLLWEQIET